MTISFSILFVFLAAIGGGLLYYNISVFCLKNKKIKEFVKKKSSMKYGLGIGVVLVLSVCAAVVLFFGGFTNGGSHYVNDCGGEVSGVQTLQKSENLLQSSSLFPKSQIERIVIDFNQTIISKLNSSTMNSFVKNVTEHKNYMKGDAKEEFDYDLGRLIRNDFERFVSNIPNYLKKMVEDVSGKTNALFRKVSIQSQIITKHVQPMNHILSKTSSIANNFDREVKKGISSDYIGSLDLYVNVAMIITIIFIIKLLIITGLIFTYKGKSCILKYACMSGYVIYFIFLCSSLGAVIGNGMMISTIESCKFNNKKGLASVVHETERDSACQTGNAIFMMTNTHIDISPILQVLKNDVENHKSEIIKIVDKTTTDVINSMKSILTDETRKRRAYLDNNYDTNGCQPIEFATAKSIADSVEVTIEFFQDLVSNLSKNKKHILADITEFQTTLTTSVTQYTSSMILDIQNILQKVNKLIDDANFKCRPFLDSFENCHVDMCGRLTDFNKFKARKLYCVIAIFGLIGVCGAYVGFWAQSLLLKNQKDENEIPVKNNDVEANSNTKSKSKSTNKTGDIKSKTVSKK
ncbi:unnamed protein product [Caenorhabditis angaria]|uniref:Uncharacterized protein n=1 Tax=Caenorhabditis angaria TaxID=860376 RepID=A0A9P1ILJ2_9PELO|nr:unnamed protein product [Caenorhabditis angaria]